MGLIKLALSGFITLFISIYIRIRSCSCRAPPWLSSPKSQLPRGRGQQLPPFCYSVVFLIGNGDGAMLDYLRDSTGERHVHSTEEEWGQTLMLHLRALSLWAQIHPSGAHERSPVLPHNHTHFRQTTFGEQRCCKH